jgi:transcriptional regulator with XRE-family HTH domain
MYADTRQGQTDTTDIFKANLKHLRQSKGLTQATLGNLSGHSTATIAHMEAGAGNITLERIEKLAKGLRVPPWRQLWTQHHQQP